MASTSSINSSSSGSQAPNPPPRTHSRPNQPPPPPPLPSVPPVPPTRDSSKGNAKMGATFDGIKFLDYFETLFKPLEELPPPEPFMNKPKSYPSQRAQQKQPNASSGINRCEGSRQIDTR